jgi:hypothetical protein
MQAHSAVALIDFDRVSAYFEDKSSNKPATQFRLTDGIDTHRS